MLKKGLFALVGICCALSLCLPVFAGSYVDDCNSLSSDGVRDYKGFSEAVGDFDVFSGWSVCGDATALAVGDREAQATYRIGGAQTVRVEFYASVSTCATPVENNQYVPGGNSTAALGNARRCFYDRANDAVFLTENGRNYSLRGEPLAGLIFREDSRPLSFDCYWGLNLSASADGVAFTPLQEAELTRIESQWLESRSGRYYRETYTARLPADARYIRVAFEDVHALEGAPDRTRAFLLSRVQFEGEALTPGGGPGPEEPSSSASSGSSESSSAQESSSSVPEAGGSGGDSGSNESSSGRLLGERRDAVFCAPSGTEAGSPASSAPRNRDAAAAARPESAADSLTRETAARPEGPETSGGIRVYHNLGGEEASGPAATPQEKFGGVVGGGAGLYILLNFLRGIRR